MISAIKGSDNMGGTHLKKLFICSECEHKIGVFEGYRHPAEGKKYVCKKCYEVLENSVDKYTNFISKSIDKTCNGPVCFVLISAAPRYEKKIYYKLSKIPEILELYPLLGGYDFIIKICARNSYELGQYVIKNIRSIEGINKTITLTGTFSLGSKK